MGKVAVLFIVVALQGCTYAKFSTLHNCSSTQEKFLGYTFFSRIDCVNQDGTDSNLRQIVEAIIGERLEFDKEYQDRDPLGSRNPVSPYFKIDDKGLL